jgi:hypothetical protein
VQVLLADVSARHPAAKGNVPDALRHVSLKVQSGEQVASNWAALTLGVYRYAGFKSCERAYFWPHKCRHCRRASVW